MTTIEFFHDAVCGWCYLLSPRLRDVASRYKVNIVHRSYVLQRNNEEMVLRFGSLDQAKIEILEHWKHCQSFADDPSLINIEGMSQSDFHYPSGFNAALATKTAEFLNGQLAHWNYFDAVQNAHLKLSQNIEDKAILLDIAESMGYERTQFSELMSSKETLEAVNQDNQRARTLGVQSIPSMLFDGQRLVSQTMSVPQLEALFKEQQVEPITEETTNV